MNIAVSYTHLDVYKRQGYFVREDVVSKQILEFPRQIVEKVKRCRDSDMKRLTQDRRTWRTGAK